MKITIKNYTKNLDNTTIEYLVEREKETYNNIVETVILSNAETIGLTENEIKTLGFKRIKPVAIRVFEQIEPLDELDNPVDFTLVSSVPKRIDIYGTNTLTVGQSFEYNATVYDQYNLRVDVELTWTNEVINATEKGIVKVTASAGNVTNSMDVSIVERVKTEVEILRTEQKLSSAQNTVETMDLIFALNEQNKLEQAQSSAEMIEIIMAMKGGV